ncbi:GGDEF domain-containing protein [Methylibium sp. Pch-M]|uniref:sensor domain-containing protein n=1 Tax=Methylibium sp. Pch-M TaxID=2082386 RepID=UPI001012D48B|nr:EAL domain-containing protein [Methylibium sp. Pch-M]QAZ39847.1 GGDEF domain-containing protein [Methylibium sp. Pch-M]
MGAAVPRLTEDPCSWDDLPSAVLLLARDGRASHANAAFCRLTGLSAEAARGAGWQRLLTDPDRATLLGALAQGEHLSLPLHLCSPGGHDEMRREVWVDCVAQWRPSRGRWVCVLHDVSATRQAERVASVQAEQLRLLADSVPALIACYDAREQRCLFANRPYALTFGRDEQSILGLPITEVIGEAALQRIRPQLDTVLIEQRAVAYERQLVRADGRTQWVEVHLLPQLATDGRLIAFFVLISDISRHRLAEQAVRESEERLGKFMQASAEGIVFHKDGVITDANAPIGMLVGYGLDELLGRRTLDFVAPDQVSKVAAVMSSGQETTYESALIDKSGRRIPVEFIVRTMMRGDERLRMTIVRDIRDRHAAQAHIHHLAHHDALTGLPNRLAFMAEIDQLMARAAESREALALLFIDLDHFKRVNDSLGHLAGDELLKTVAQRIGAVLRASDVVARFGGDEFMVLIGGGPRLEDVADVARKLLAAIEVPLDAEAGRSISVTPSIGIAMFPGDGVTPAELIKHADTAMYRAKARGRATYQFFDPTLASNAYAALVLEGELAQALERGEFVLHFQPQVRAGDGVLVGAEALIRWQHPERGLLLPDQFIPLAEQQRLMLPIGTWVLHEAARAARRWHDDGLCAVPVAVNLSAVQFQAPDFVATVAQALAGAGLPGRLLELELTERMLMDELPEVSGRLAQLKALGIRLSVDDFGTGYSSLGHLKSLPIDKMKIDRSFVVDLPEARGSVAIARAIIQMASSLGITVIAEGVETEAQRAFLAREQCDELQGEAISPSLSLQAFETWAGRVASG